MKVLVVDDNEAIRTMVTKVLQIHEDFKVVTAENGTIALSKYEKFKPDVVILDIIMPIMDGLEVLKRLRQMDDHAAVIMASAASSPDSIEECRKAGAIGFIIKPFHAQELIETIKKLVKPGTEHDRVLNLYSRIAIDIERTMRKMTDDTLSITLKGIEFEGLEKKIIIPDNKIAIITEITGERTGELVALADKQTMHQILSAQNESITPEEESTATLELSSVINHDVIIQLMSYTGQKLKLEPPRLFDKETDENVTTQGFIKITLEKTWKGSQEEIIIYQCLN